MDVGLEHYVEGKSKLLAEGIFIELHISLTMCDNIRSTSPNALPPLLQFENCLIYLSFPQRAKHVECYKFSFNQSKTACLATGMMATTGKNKATVVKC